MARDIVQVRKLRDARAFDAHLVAIGTTLPRHPAPADVLGTPVEVLGRTLANRWAVLPMEGWDGTADGRPTELVRRRWRRFGRSGAALVWGGEAVAVRADGRANPHQLAIGPESVGDLAALRTELVAGYAEVGGDPAGPLVGLQLTHSGRWSGPAGHPEPRTAFRHPLLDPVVGAAAGDVVTDAWLDDLIAAFAAAARSAQEAGFDFVDVKHCHGYLLHELLAARARPGRYGGDLTGRTRFLADAVAAIRRDAPGLPVAIRLSAFDVVPYVPGVDGRGVPAATGAYPYSFGGDGTGLGVDLREPLALLDLVAELDVTLICVTAGSPYYTPHVQRPAFFPPSDGYTPPEDPLVGVARLVRAAADIKAARPGLTVVGSGYTYLQEWLPHVAQHEVGGGHVDFVGLGRMVLSYPELPRDVLAGRALARKKICRTFSDCTSGPRNGLPSGCYPLDEHYRSSEDARTLEAIKERLR
jgi:2,4-dienoyl-CoA reductase-like NADH-dependent reductase (Old Yellow Enzyme family)